MAQPSRLEEIEQLIGVTHTLKLVKRYGGTHIQFPSRYREDWEIALLLGRPAANQLLGRFSGTRLYIAKRAADLRHRRNRASSTATPAGHRWLSWPGPTNSPIVKSGTSWAVPRRRQGGESERG